jgi:hypothetical protein
LVPCSTALQHHSPCSPVLCSGAAMHLPRHYLLPTAPPLACTRCTTYTALHCTVLPCTRCTGLSTACTPCSITRQLSRILHHSHHHYHHRLNNRRRHHPTLAPFPPPHRHWHHHHCPTATTSHHQTAESAPPWCPERSMPETTVPPGRRPPTAGPARAGACGQHRLRPARIGATWCHLLPLTSPPRSLHRRCR